MLIRAACLISSVFFGMEWMSKSNRFHARHSRTALVVDTGYFVRFEKGKAFIAVFEALTSWKREIGGRLASYGAAPGDKYKMPIRVYPLPMAPHACPKSPPEFGRTQWGDVEVAVRLRWIKPWEIDAAAVLEHHSPTLDAWAVLFDCSAAQREEMLRRLKSKPPEAGMFRMLGGMRYRKDDSGWKELIQRFDSMITREKMRESRAVQEWLQEGREEGEVKGLQIALLTCIEQRFPEAEAA